MKTVFKKQSGRCIYVHWDVQMNTVEMKRLKELKALKPYLNLSALARYLGMTRNGLFMRLERGQPELTTVEAEKLTALLEDPLGTLGDPESEDKEASVS